MIKTLKDEEIIQINLFGIEENVKVICLGSNRFDNEGRYKKGSFDFTNEEIDCLNWFIDNIHIDSYKDEIVSYCNEAYSSYCEKQISVENIKDEICITHIAISICDEFDEFYPDISYFGECKCDQEHGICIGFKNKNFIGVSSQDWVL